MQNYWNRQCSWDMGGDNDDLRADIDNMMAEIFSNAQLNTDSDPLASSNSENDSDSSSEYWCGVASG